MNIKYPVNTEVRFVDPYINWITGELTYYTLRMGKVIDHTDSGYTIDPWASGHYGHKRYNIPEEDIWPTEERLENLRKIAPVNTCEGWKNKKI